MPEERAFFSAELHEVSIPSPFLAHVLALGGGIYVGKRGLLPSAGTYRGRKGPGEACDPGSGVLSQQLISASHHCRRDPTHNSIFTYANCSHSHIQCFIQTLLQHFTSRIPFLVCKTPYGVSNPLASLGHTGRRTVVLCHTLNTLGHKIHKKISHNVLSKFTILCWATFTALLSRRQAVGHRLDVSARIS